MNYEELTKKLREFARERDWEQFHSPKNLAMSLSVEVAEIVEIFQWLTQKQSWELESKKLEKLKDEIGDVQIYLTMLADKLGINSIEAAHDKIKKNQANYPVNLAKGKSDKYKEL